MVTTYIYLLNHILYIIYRLYYSVLKIVPICFSVSILYSYYTYSCLQMVKVLNNYHTIAGKNIKLFTIFTYYTIIIV